MLNVEDKFFHGVSFCNWEFVPDDLTNLDLLESVLKDSYIFTRNSLCDNHQNMFRCLYNHSYNGEDKVSISCHVLGYDKYNDKNYSNYHYRYNSAFDYFVYNNFSIILDKSVLDNYSFCKNGMLGEYQVYGDISLKYMIGLGIPNFFGRMCDEVLKILKKDNYLSYRHDYYIEKLRWSKDIIDFLEHGYCKIGYYEYEKVRELLSKYNYDVCMVDPETGLEWLSKEVMKEKVEYVRDLAISRRLIR